MNKRTLMLSAAAAALLSGPALADTTITTVSTSAHKTSTDGNIIINSGAGINAPSSTVPLLTIDSSNTVNNGGSLSAANQTNQLAVQINAGGFTGGFLTNGAIDLTGTGTGKNALRLTGTSFFAGNITFDGNSTVNILGDQSIGVLTDSGTTLHGNLSFGGTFAMAQSTAGSTTASGVTVAQLLGDIKGNLVIASGAQVAAIGQGARAIVLTGNISACDPLVVVGCTQIGTFANSGTIAVAGINQRSATAVNPESDSAVVIGGNLAGGFLNNGPINTADSVNSAGSISGNGIGDAATIVVAPGLSATAGVTLGAVTTDTNGAYGFINRGTIASAPVDSNLSTRTIAMAGSSAAAPVTITGGIFNSGAIIAQASSSSSVTAGLISPAQVSATALFIGNFTTVPEIRVSGQSVAAGSTRGSIGAIISGPEGGTATAIFINGTTGTSVPLITVEAGARISAAATVSPDITASNLPSGFVMNAVAIRDASNSLTAINNAGTISASAGTTDGSALTTSITPTKQAVNALTNTVGLTFDNTGTVTGDVLFGSGSDSYYTHGTASVTATHSGAIAFGFGTDTLRVGAFANVAGSITASGNLDVQVDQTGTLSVQNIGSTLATRTLTVDGGSPTSAGTINITVSQGVTTQPVITASNNVTFTPGANLNVAYGSFVTSGGAFTLIQAPTGQLVISDADVARYNAAVGGGSTLPFLFASASITKPVGGDGAGHDVLLLSVVPKTAAQLGLVDLGRAMFTNANAAIVAADPALGAALVAGVNAANAQQTYDAFAPDVSGGGRAIAVALTDQATGVVAARNRTLHLFAKGDGDLTLWGNEFGQYISNKGGTVRVSDPATANFGSANGFKDRGFGFSVGLDEGSASGGWYGAAFTFYTGDIAETGTRVPDKVNTLWYMFTGYTTWRGRGLFVDTQLTVGLVDFKGKRFLSLDLPASGTTPASTFLREADNKHSGLYGALGLTMGAVLRYGATTITPQLSIDGLSMREEGYTETGGGQGFNLTVTPTYANSLRTYIGTEFRQDINAGDFLLQPSLKIGYRYDFLNDPTRLRARFADINPSATTVTPGALMILQGADPSQGGLIGGVNLNATTENWTIGINYDFVRGTHNETEQVGTISLLGRI